MVNNTKQLLISLSSKDLVAEVEQAKKVVVFCSKNLHWEFARVLGEVAKRSVTVKVLIDPSEENYRNGFGDFNAIKHLEKDGAGVYELPGNEISFLITDTTGYYLFPQSQLFTYESTGPNAVLMDGIARDRLLRYFFPDDESLLKSRETLLEELQGEVSAMDQMAVGRGFESLIPIDREKLAIVELNLNNNPPLMPDTHRLIKLYSAKVQFVELRFSGANLMSTKISLPTKALPIKNDALISLIETRMRLFRDLSERPVFQELNAIKESVEGLRLSRKKKNEDDTTDVFFGTRMPKVNNPKKREEDASYLIPLTCREGKSIIKVDKKARFEAEVHAIKERLVELRAKAVNELQKEINKTIAVLREELTMFFRKNPPIEYQYYEESVLNDSIKNSVEKILTKIKFPHPSDMLDKLGITLHYYDLTFQDIQDKELISEMRDRGIIVEKDNSDFVRYRDAFPLLGSAEDYF